MGDDKDDQVLENVGAPIIVLLAADTWKALAPRKTVPPLPLLTRKRNANVNTAGMERIILFVAIMIMNLPRPMSEARSQHTKKRFWQENVLAGEGHLLHPVSSISVHAC